MFKAQKISETACYPNTTVLVNKLNLRNQQLLSMAEDRIVSQRYMAAEAETAFHHVDFAFYQSLHKQLFESVYAWAGTIRTVNISKNGTLFCDVSLIESQGEQIFRQLAQQNYLCDLPQSAFLDALTELYQALNMLHPFREGNGRTLRLFLTLLSRNAGWEICLRACAADAWKTAALCAAENDLLPMRQLLASLLAKKAA